MKKAFILLLLVNILGIGYYFYSVIQRSEEEMKLHDFRVIDVPDAELKFLKTLDPSQFHAPKFESGIYVLEVQMPSGEVTRSEIEIPFKDNAFAFGVSNTPVGRVGMKESAKMKGHVVSWHDEGVFYDAGVRYVGVVSGTQMHGHVYNYQQTPHGEVGFWRLYSRDR
jgi:hypothetical protein